MKLIEKIKLVSINLVEDLIRPISGPLGIFIRRVFYSKRLKKCGKNLTIHPYVYIEGVDCIEFGDNVNIDKYTTISACSIDHQSNSHNVKFIKNSNYKMKIGNLKIGDNAHISSHCIISAIGGVDIGDNFTMSSFGKIYSWSNDKIRSMQGTIGKNRYYILSPIVIRNNVWLGINTTVFKGTIGDNVFSNPNSVIISDIEENSVVSEYGVKLKQRFECNMEGS